MYGTVSTAAIIGMIFSLVIAVAGPIGLLIVWKKTQHANLSAFFIGAATFILFALVLEQLFHRGMLGFFSTKITGSIWVYALYGGLAAALFEETGRCLAMKLCMKKTLNRKNAILYGIGHGGVEAILVVGLTEISNIFTAIAINAGTIDGLLNVAPDQKAAIIAQISALWTTAPAAFYLAGVERIIAIVLHICLSYLVYRAVAYGLKKCWLMAFGLHFAVDSVAVALNSMISPFLLEVLLAAAVALLLWWTVGLYRKDGKTSSMVPERP